MDVIKEEIKCSECNMIVEEVKRENKSEIKTERKDEANNEMETKNERNEDLKQENNKEMSCKEKIEVNKEDEEHKAAIKDEIMDTIKEEMVEAYEECEYIPEATVKPDAVDIKFDVDYLHEQNVKRIKTENSSPTRSLEKYIDEALRVGHLALPVDASYLHDPENEGMKTEQPAEEDISTNALNDSKNKPSLSTMNIDCPTPSNGNSNNKEHRSSNAIIIINCAKCPFTCTNVPLFDLHRIVHHSTPPFKCAECEYSSSEAIHFYNHILTHTNDQLPEVTESLDEEILQTKNVSEDEIINPGTSTTTILIDCSRCSFTCQNDRSFDLHWIVHSSYSPFQCSECPFSSDQACTFNGHVLTHEIDRYACLYCRSMYSQRSHLDEHIASVHRMVLKCDLCNHTANTLAKFKIHMKTAHSKPLRYLRCDKCKYIFTKSESLELHKVVHDSTLPYQCLKCKYKTNTIYDFNDHIYTHTKDKRFPCPYCNIGFMWFPYLQNHIKSKHSSSEQCVISSTSKATSSLIND